MKKIPTLFERDPENRRWVLPKVTPGCEWVLAGEGTPTRKFDGTCVMVDEHGALWARREIKPGKEAPPHFVEVEHDETTGKTVGWEPAGYSGFSRYIDEAVAGETFAPGTYELCGPKVNGNPEGYEMHILVRHGRYVVTEVPRSFDELIVWLRMHPFEGVVWHHPDGRMAKLKKRDVS